MSLTGQINQPIQVYSTTTKPITPRQREYLRELIGISFGIGITDEVADSLKLINSTLLHGKYFEFNSDQLNDLQRIFNYQKNKNKNFL